MQILYSLYLTIYRMNLWLLLILMALFGVIWAVFTSSIAAQKPKQNKLYNIILLCLFVNLIVYITILDRNNTNDVILYTHPFHTFSAARQEPELYRAVFMNIVLFYPVGAIMSCMIQKNSWETTLLLIFVTALFSSCIECYQFVARLGEGDIDDVIFNTFGAILGYCVSKVGKWIYKIKFLPYR